METQLTSLIVGIISMLIGSVLGYFARQSIARKQAGTLEQKIHEKISQVKERAEKIIAEAKEKATDILEAAKREENRRKRTLFKTEQLILKRENALENKILRIEKREEELQRKIQTLRGIKESLEDLRREAEEKLEKISGFSKKEAKKELMQSLEKEYQKEILEKIQKLENEGKEKLERRAKDIVAQAIQKVALSQAQEITTSVVSLPSDEIKGRIIGKEGRNIKVFEKLTGVEVIVDDTPEAVVISGFDPIRREIAKVALEKLVQDGRIQPARIEEIVSEAEKLIVEQIKKAGERAAFEVGVIGLDPKLIHLLGRLRFRTSFGQNVLLHSIEVAHLAGALAGELGADVKVCQKAGLLHDIGKSVDHHVQGSHTEIGIKILEKFNQPKEIIDAIKSHHGEYKAETLEAILVQVADQISGARPGARKDTLENYLKRLEELEEIANSFSGVEKAFAIQAGREIRVFVNPEQIDDLGCYKLAKDIANRIEQDLRYPGEIKVNVIRENRVVEYAK